MGVFESITGYLSLFCKEEYYHNEKGLISATVGTMKVTQA